MREAGIFPGNKGAAAVAVDIAVVPVAVEGVQLMYERHFCFLWLFVFCLSRCTPRAIPTILLRNNTRRGDPSAKVSQAYHIRFSSLDRAAENVTSLMLHESD